MMLTVQNLTAGYGTAQVLHGADLTLDQGRAVAVLGRNGVGKTTFVHALMGLVRPSSGSIRLAGRELSGLDTRRIARLGVRIVPQGRRVFRSLTVAETLEISRSPGEWTVERVYQIFPALAARRRHRGDQLSGGEQEMLAIGRALLGNPRLLLLDEPSEGLAPRLVEELGVVLAGLRATGISVVLVEQNLRLALEVADEVRCMVKGRFVYGAAAGEFAGDGAAIAAYLGVGS
ncbi:ABC transporter ATP-binding protein [Nonomuraea endophytica]|uniref:Branched-chain amino acid transport system ATP-binding protein n=1 Tax=Nonomuraea endophytica TaxID=714136 RepID=A0A7W8EKN8_9ACTN|nr:ABC transporter ATP-binding protein [Nonomuraea endophytica]MBB5082781.1 branched-chain amino acid transport system ATP-binding protein [Nonomuraea endophytica]